MKLQEFITYLENYKLYYHGNSYKETLNYTFSDNLNRLKRLAHQESSESRNNNIRYSINEILYCIQILTPEIIPEIRKFKKVEY